MGCHLCEMRAENDALRAKAEKEWLDLGVSLLTDIESPMPIKITLNTKPTMKQWRRMLDLVKEIDSNNKER